MSDDDAPPLRFQRLDAGVWAWTRDGDPVAGTSDPNPRIALEEGLQLLKVLWEEGEVPGEAVRASVEEARRNLREAASSDAVEAADRLAGRFLWRVQGG